MAGSHSDIVSRTLDVARTSDTGYSVAQLSLGMNFVCSDFGLGAKRLPIATYFVHYLSVDNVVHDVLKENAY